MANPPPLTAGRSANPGSFIMSSSDPPLGSSTTTSALRASTRSGLSISRPPVTPASSTSLGGNDIPRRVNSPEAPVLGISDDHQLRRREDVLRQKSGLTLQPRQPLCERIDLPVCRLDDLVGSRLLVENPAENLHLVLPRINLDVGQTGNCRSDLAQLVEIVLIGDGEPAENQIGIQGCNFFSFEAGHRTAGSPSDRAPSPTRPRHSPTGTDHARRPSGRQPGTPPAGFRVRAERRATGCRPRRCASAYR